MTNTEEKTKKIPTPENLKEYPIDQLKKIYGDEITQIFKSINKLKSTSIDFLQSEIKEISKDYDSFTVEINKNINLNAYKCIKLFKLENKSNADEEQEKLSLVLKINEEKMEAIKNILHSHEQIIDTIRENIICLKKFLNICHGLELNTMNEFYENQFENLSKNWLLLKLNLNNFNISNILNKYNIDPNLKDLIRKTCIRKNISYVVQNPIWEENKKMSEEETKERRIKRDNDIKTISENKNNIMSLKMKNVTEADGYFEKSISFSKLKGLLLENVTLQNSDILNLFPFLYRLKIKNCQSLDLNIFKYLSTNLRKLYLIKNGFVNLDFKKIIKDYLIKSQSIRDNLEVLSFANNNISIVDFNHLLVDGQDKFLSLKELDFRKNKLTSFIYNEALFPSLNFINLCNNCLDKEALETKEGFVVLETGNNYLMDATFRKQHFEKLYKTISNENAFPISYLNISYLPGKFSEDYFKNLKISGTLLIGLNKLTLSCNKLTCGMFFNFIDKINDTLYLKKLNLSGNQIDDTFFETFLEKKLYLIFPKLEHISLSSNLIGDDKVTVKYKDNLPLKNETYKKEIYKLRLMYKFIEQNKNLTKINITKNPMSEIFTIVPEEKKDADVNPKYITKDKEDSIIIDGLFSFLIKIRDELIGNKKEYKIISSRKSFSVKFDCRSNINKYSENYPYSERPIIYKE